MRVLWTHHDPAHISPKTTHVFGQTVDDEIGTARQGALARGRGKGVIDDDVQPRCR
jgi:hypothetical protein